MTIASPRVSNMGPEKISRNGKAFSSAMSDRRIPDTSQATRTISTELSGKTSGPSTAIATPGMLKSASGYATDRDASTAATTTTQSRIASFGRARVGYAASGPIRAAPPSIRRARLVIAPLPAKPAAPRAERRSFWSIHQLRKVAPALRTGRVVRLVDHLRAEHDRADDRRRAVAQVRGRGRQVRAVGHPDPRDEDDPVGDRSEDRRVGEVRDRRRVDDHQAVALAQLAHQLAHAAAGEQ